MLLEKIINSPLSKAPFSKVVFLPFHFEVKRLKPDDPYAIDAHTLEHV